MTEVTGKLGNVSLPGVNIIVPVLTSVRLWGAQQLKNNSYSLLPFFRIVAIYKALSW